jgi:hypothetical protein
MSKVILVADESTSGSARAAARREANLRHCELWVAVPVGEDHRQAAQDRAAIRTQVHLAITEGGDHPLDPEVLVVPVPVHHPVRLGHSDDLLVLTEGSDVDPDTFAWPGCPVLVVPR